MCESMILKDNFIDALTIMHDMYNADPYDCEYYHQKLIEIGLNPEFWDILTYEIDSKNDLVARGGFEPPTFGL